MTFAGHLTILLTRKLMLPLTLQTGASLDINDEEGAGDELSSQLEKDFRIML